MQRPWWRMLLLCCEQLAFIRKNPFRVGYVKPVNPPESITYGAYGNANGLHLRGFPVMYRTFPFSQDLSQ